MGREERWEWSHRRRNIASRFPRKLNCGLVFSVCPLDLSVRALDHIAIVVVPAALAFWLVIIEVAFKVGSILVKPLSVYHLAVLECADVFHASFFENIVVVDLFQLWTFKFFVWRFLLQNRTIVVCRSTYFKSILKFVRQCLIIRTPTHHSLGSYDYKVGKRDLVTILLKKIRNPIVWNTFLKLVIILKINTTISTSGWCSIFVDPKVHVIVLSKPDNTLSKSSWISRIFIKVHDVWSDLLIIFNIKIWVGFDLHICCPTLKRRTVINFCQLFAYIIMLVIIICIIEPFDEIHSRILLILFFDWAAQLVDGIYNWHLYWWGFKRQIFHL